MNTRQTLWFLAKVTFAVGVVVWLLSKVDAAQVWSYLRSAYPRPVLLGLAVGVVMVGLASWRWVILLRVFGLPLPWRQLFCINWIGQFFMMFLPGPAGDDITRMLYISRLAKGRVGLACSTVLIDRCVGLSSVFVLSVFCLPLQWALLAGNTQTRLLAFVVVAGGLCVAVAGLLFLLGGGGGGLVFRLVRLLPSGKLRATLEESWHLLCANKGTLFSVFAIALLTQLMNCAALYCAGQAVGISASLATWCSFVPVVLAANILPITVAGLGVREYLLVLFLGVLAGTTPEQALAASAVAFGMMLVVCLGGGLVYLFYRPENRGSSPSADS
ncbi:MAG: lysylphosphatidylglycerol synthase transmembrane domain-containing protein [Sphaerospermopsis kisseleviana]